MVDSLTSERERPAWGKASHRGSGGHRGGCRKALGGQLGLGLGKTPACIKCLLVPGGRVLNPQSYHSAFRISSTRHQEAAAGRRRYIALDPSASQNWQSPGSIVIIHSAAPCYYRLSACRELPARFKLFRHAAMSENFWDILLDAIERGSRSSGRWGFASGDRR